MRRIAAEVAVLVLAGTAPLVAQYFGQNKVQYRTFDFRSEEHTSELQSQSNLVCRLLLEKKKNQPSQRELPQHPPNSQRYLPDCYRHQTRLFQSCQHHIHQSVDILTITLLLTA